MRTSLAGLSLVVVACRSPIAPDESEDLQRRADRVGAALDAAIDAAGRDPDEPKRVGRLARLNRLSNALGRARLVGYMSYVEKDVERFREAEATLGELERELKVRP
jgi:hypothetical protein